MNEPSRLAQPDSRPLAAPVVAVAANTIAPVLRRRVQVEPAVAIGTTARQVLSVINRVQAEGKSETLLLWPQRPDSIAIFHALSALTHLASCDTHTLLTIFFPWNRNATASQRTLLADRDFVDRAVLGPLNRIAALRPQHPAFGYVMALHSLRHVMSGRKKNARLSKAVKADPGLLHPTLFDMMPQCGVYEDATQSYDDQFLRRLRRHTWIGDCKEHMGAATDALRTPFFLFGVHSDAATVKSLRAIGLDPKRFADLRGPIMEVEIERYGDRTDYPADVLMAGRRPLLQFPEEALEATIANPRSAGVAVKDGVSGRIVAYALGSREDTGALFRSSAGLSSRRERAPCPSVRSGRSYSAASRRACALCRPNHRPKSGARF